MSRSSALARLAAAYAAHEVRRRSGRGGGRTTASAFETRYARDGLRPLTADERGGLPAMSGCINCGLCALVAGRPGGVRPADLATAYLRDYPLLAAAASDLGPGASMEAAAAACPVGVPLAEVSAAVRRLSG